jgi:hypothetical protein
MRGDIYAQDDLLNQVNAIERKGVGADLQLGNWDPIRGTWDNIAVVQPGLAPIGVQTFNAYTDQF